MASKVAERILQAAIASFAESGFHGSTTKEICTRADCTEGSLFRLFGSKEKLFEAALRKSLDLRMSSDELLRILENDPNFERGLRKAMLEFFDRLDDGYLRLATYAMLERPEIARELIFNLPTTITRAIARMIELEALRGNLRKDLDPITAALQIVSSLSHLAFVAPIAVDFKVHSREARRGAVKNFVEIWFHGVQKPSSRTPRKTG